MRQIIQFFIVIPLLIVYVDNIVITGNDVAEITQLKDTCCVNTFKPKILGASILL